MTSVSRRTPNLDDPGIRFRLGHHLLPVAQWEIRAVATLPSAQPSGSSGHAKDRHYVKILSCIPWQSMNLHGGDGGRWTIHVVPLFGNTISLGIQTVATSYNPSARIYRSHEKWNTTDCQNVLSMKCIWKLQNVKHSYGLKNWTHRNRAVSYTQSTNTYPINY